MKGNYECKGKCIVTLLSAKSKWPVYVALGWFLVRSVRGKAKSLNLKSSITRWKLSEFEFVMMSRWISISTPDRKTEGW